jgi:hypothetical protein
LNVEFVASCACAQGVIREQHIPVSRKVKDLQLGDALSIAIFMLTQGRTNGKVAYFLPARKSRI